MRAHLLGNAVRIDKAVLPHLDEAFRTIAARIEGCDDIECYVFSEAGINAFVTQGRQRTLVALSSGAVDALTQGELEFVIGHELGHASFGHLELEVGRLVAEGGLGPSSCMRARAWQRAAEISADRAGLLACGSIEIAASALFKTVSGLLREDIVMRPEEFAGQWQTLLAEVSGDGERDHWNFSHPFPPLRMRAMVAFWKAFEARNPDGDDASQMASSEKEIRRMLDMMDPASGDEALGDPLLTGFFYWGGYYVALADGVLHPAEVDRLMSVLPNGVEAPTAEAPVEDASCLTHFKESIEGRHKKLSAVELHRIVYGLIDVAAADGHIDENEIVRLRELGDIIGVPGDAVELIVGQYKKEMGDDD